MLRNLLLAILAVQIFALPASAQQAPADAMIKAVVTDLDKYEKAAKGLTPAHKRQINNIQRFLPITKSRLSSSRNKSHPTWIEASNRLKALTQRLSDLKAGKKTTTVAAPAKVTAPANAPVDRTVKAVLADLDRHQKSAKGLTSAHTRQINNILRFLPSTKSRLDSARNKSHPS